MTAVPPNYEEPVGFGAARSGSGGLRILLISHAYLEPEHFKTFLELRRHVDARLLVPRRLPTPSHLRGKFFKTLSAYVVTSQCPEPIVVSRRAICWPGSKHVSQYALASLSLGVRRCRPDIIHVDLPPWSPVFWQAVLARRLFSPSASIVVSAKKNTYRRHGGARGWIKHTVARAGLRQTALVVAASDMAAKLYVREFRLLDGHVAVVPQLGVDGLLFRPGCPSAGSGACVVGYCGRMEPEKGVIDLVEAVERCVGSGSNVRLELVGSGSLDDHLAILAASRSWLVLHGAVPGHKIPDFMRRLDLFVLAARVLADHEEHDAHALREALASRVATIGTRSGVIPDLLSDGTGLLVDAGDPAALAGAIQSLVSDPEMRQRLARTGWEKATRALVCEPVAAACADRYGEVARSAHDRISSLQT